jgi:hypothetical protein
MSYQKRDNRPSELKGREEPIAMCDKKYGVRGWKGSWSVWLVLGAMHDCGGYEEGANVVLLGYVGWLRDDLTLQIIDDEKREVWMLVTPHGKVSAWEL